jgi:hypothetical protein
MAMGILRPRTGSKKEKENRECRVGAPLKLHTGKCQQISLPRIVIMNLLE